MATIMRSKNANPKGAGRRMRLGKAIVTEDHRLVFFVGYCTCGCGAKFGLSPEEAKSFSRSFHREEETRLQKFVAAPGRAMRTVRFTLREARKVAVAQGRLEDRL